MMISYPRFMFTDLLLRCESGDASTTALETRPTVRKFDPEMRQNLTDFGQYVAECMPKYVQKVQLTAGFIYFLIIDIPEINSVVRCLAVVHNNFIVDDFRAVFFLN